MLEEGRQGSLSLYKDEDKVGKRIEVDQGCIKLDRCGIKISKYNYR